MRKLHNKITFLAFLFILTACKEKEIIPVDLALMNANVIDLETGEITVRNIYIAKGEIKSVEDAGAETSYKADSLIDANGKYVLPGFWDNHIHLRGGDSLIANNKNFLKLFIANGITTVRVLEAI